MKLKLLTFSLLGIAALASCKREASNSNLTTPGNANVAKIAPNGFNYNTTNNVKLNVSLLTNNNEPISGVVVNVYAPGHLGADSSLFRGVTDKSGNLVGTISVPSSLTQLIIDPAYIGLIRYATANINGSSVTATIGGKTGFSGDIAASAAASKTLAKSRALRQNNESLLSTDYVYPTGYTAANAFASPTNLGVPAYLDPTSDNISATELAYVNASLPDGTSLATSHPQFLNSSANINVVSTGDIYITFVSEGAAYLNSLAYFTYPTNLPPTLSSGGTLFGAPDKITYVFPNASASGSGGGLVSGQRVHLGSFSAGTTISFVLVQNGFNGSGVTSGNTKFYSINSFNPESNSSLRQHAVMLYDALDKVNFIGFEDTNRQTGGSDNDFNDLVVYASSNPAAAISETGVQNVDKGLDTDGDGVPDQLDAFPNDPTKAFVTYFPTQTTYADIAFEDNWPSKGDYDMNDLVVKYRYTFIGNSLNQIVSMTGDYAVDAAGASFKNGFGVQLPVIPSVVQSVTGYKLSNGTYIKLASNGVEAGQSLAVIIPFDTHDQMIQNPDFSYFVNTDMSKAKVTGQIASVVVNFNIPIDPLILNASTLNPFLISNMRRGYEVHLPGYVPTDLANLKLFGTGDDNSVPLLGRYYLSSSNWPWAIAYPQQFNYPVEGVSIDKAYNHFTDWTGSAGLLYMDWFFNTAPGYRNSANVYSK